MRAAAAPQAQSNTDGKEQKVKPEPVEPEPVKEQPQRRRRCQGEDGAANLRTFTTNYLHAISTSPLIGKRQETVQVDGDYGKLIAKGLRKEAAVEAAAGRDGNLVVPVNCLPLWYVGDASAADLADLFDRCPQDELARHVVWTYSVESFLQTVLNRVLRDQDETRKGFAPFIRLLHDTLFHRWGGLTPYDGPAYRVMHLDDATAEMLSPLPVADKKDARANIVAWEDFASCSCKASCAFERYEPLKANALVTITSAPGQHPVDVRRFSDWGDDEGDVMFALGQQFHKKSVEKRPCGEVWKELGVVSGAKLDGEMWVVELMAVDAFYDFAEDIFREGAGEQEAVELLEQRVALEKERSGDDESVAVGVAMNYLAKAYRLQGKLKESLDLLEKELEITRKHFGDDHAVTAASYESLGVVLVTMGNYDDGIDMHRKCMEKRIEIYGEDCTDVAHCYSNIAIGMLRKENYQESLEHNQKALAIRLNHLGQFHADTALSYGNIAEAYRMMGENDEALENHKKALEIREVVLDPRHPSIGDNLLNIALIHSTLKQRDLALQNFEAALSISLEQLGEHHASIGIIYNGMAYLEMKTSHLEEAIPLFTKARDIFTAALGPEHAHTKYAEKGLRKCEEKVAKKRSQAASKNS